MTENDRVTNVSDKNATTERLTTISLKESQVYKQQRPETPNILGCAPLNVFAQAVIILVLVPPVGTKEYVHIIISRSAQTTSGQDEVEESVEKDGKARKHEHTAWALSRNETTQSRSNGQQV